MVIREINIDSENDVRQVVGMFKLMMLEVNPSGKPDINVYKRYIKKMSNDMGDDYKIYVAEMDDGQIVGYIEGYIHYDCNTSKKRAFGSCFYVYPEYRDTGIPSRLYKELLREGKERGMEEIAIITWKNKVPFWERMGFNIGCYVLVKELEVV